MSSPRIPVVTARLPRGVFAAAAVGTLLPLLTGGSVAVRAQSPPATATLSLADPAPVSVVPGQTFSFTLELSSPAAAISGLDYFLAASGPGLFQLTDRSLGGSSFGAPIVENNRLFPGGAPLALNPGESLNLGATTADGSALPAPFVTVPLATFTVQALSTVAPGTYILSTTGQGAFDANGDPVALNAAFLTVSVVPEPDAGVLALLGGGGVLLLTTVVRRRRRRRQADDEGGGERGTANPTALQPAWDRPCGVPRTARGHQRTHSKRNKHVT